MNKKKFLSLLKKNEGVKLDFKREIDLSIESGRKEFAKDVCAIANSRGGRGYLIIGIEDKSKKVVGISELCFTEEQIQQIISSRCEPPIPISLEFINYQNKRLAIITIYQSNQKPYQFRENGAFYIRRGSTTDTMRKQELVTSFQENMNLNIELTPMVKSRIEHLDYEIVDKYFMSHGIEVSEENRISFMESSKIVYLDEEDKEYYITLGGLLVFSRINYLYYPNNMIRIVNKINKSLDEVKIIQGDLLSMLDKSEKHILDILPSYYPCQAVYEGIKNAVLYRDYTIIDKEIEVIIDFNSVRIISPGILIKNSKNELGNNYIKRNMWIYEKLITLDENKRFLQSGRGFSRMKKSFKNHGNVIFINSLRENYFKVIYPGITNFK
ncbi:AlbA family DNA-binding domain-containing protein [Clostridium brassicae]|uniref:DNA binding domain-containing protein n=1 Tax=Clostridium brassicae TaxID=2999072 RepID=A0ABT4D9E0_9CLOT|nr:RNA-binding domain-containing protein [Clostridium brassicae]MCY6958919.1 putative DNA binding domain-containing protein [Clostridium brassicae]